MTGKIFHRDRAFTLIELLIVVAIIAILAAIAVPNFVAAQVRAKVTRTQSDMRTLATGLESYRVDNNEYPINMYSTAHYYDDGRGGVVDPWGFKPIAHERGRTVAACLWRLTTPIAYLATVVGYASPFWHSQEYFDWMLTMEGQTSGMLNVGATYLFGAAKVPTRQMPTNDMARRFPEWPASGMIKENHYWFIYGPGPYDQTDKSATYWIRANYDKPYDPSNGTVSEGQIVRTGP